MLRLLLVLLVVLCRAVTVWSECVPRIEIAYAPLDAFLHEIIVPLAKDRQSAELTYFQLLQ